MHRVIVYSISLGIIPRAGYVGILLSPVEVNNSYKGTELPVCAVCCLSLCVREVATNFVVEFRTKNT